MTNSQASTPLSNLEALMWMLGRDPRLRPTVTAVVFCEGEVSLAALRQRLERAARVVPRLRQCVVGGASPLSTPSWATDPRFVLAHHLRLTDLGGNAPRSAVEELAAANAVQPFDRSRPLWDVTLVRGLEGPECAVIFRAHHALTDGVGGASMMLEIFDVDGRPDPVSQPPAANRALTGTRAARTDPAAAAHGLGRMLGSVARATRSPDPGTPQRPRRSGALPTFASLSAEIEPLRLAARREGGTINDAFITGVVLGIRAHHQQAGRATKSLRISVPVNTRSEPGHQGNSFVPVPVELHVGNLSAHQIMNEVHNRVVAARAQASNGITEWLAGAGRLMPASISMELVTAITRSIDLTASNIPASPLALQLCGRPVQALIPFGPLSGTGLNVSLASLAGVGHIGVVIDPDVLADGPGLVAHIRTGLQAVIEGP